MKLKTLVGALLFCSSSAFAFSFSSLTGDSLPSLTSSRSEGVGIASVAIPYANSVNYFGYIDKDSKPSAKVNGKDAYYLYMWVPAALDELGVRMISPVGNLAEPSKEDFVQKGYEGKLKKDSEKWFDTWIRVERMNVFSPEKIKKANKVFSVLDKDDDGDDTYEEERHAKYNSLVRIKTQANKPQKALTRGLYRVVFTTYKRGNVGGSFVATVGTNIPGVKMSTSLSELHKMVN
ncbi:hypothetical protein A3K86_08025 [Photobacterium jeanii]|uniref:Surface lipoprotein of Spirochaetales order domain-containing protein n=1 Tax=Photobacterium jeanii TaxID=858640 RepID=A0A178KJQ7_9GAMM|nr:LipL32 family surface lipoprotein [Photobacterium jeanii]OAN17500.1 hypothetical protein A3K86_08025 [Photobacterium jeanii]